MLAKFFGPSSYKKGTGKKILQEERSRDQEGEAGSPSANVPLMEENIEAIEREAKDIIPFRILLSVLDEIFQLKQNKWLRRRTMAVLSQVIFSSRNEGRENVCLQAGVCSFGCYFKE